MDNFKTLYRERALDDRDLKLAQNMFRRIIDVDFNDNRNYDMLYMAICGSVSEVMELYSSEELKLSLNSLEETKKNLIERRFGLVEGEFPKDVKTLASEVGITESAYRARVEKVLNQLRNSYKVNKIKIKFEEVIKDIITNEEYKLLTKEEKKVCSELLDNIYSSDIIYTNSSYKVLQEDERGDSILKGLKIMRNRFQIINEREEERKNTLLQNIDIPVSAYNYFQNIKIETIADLKKLTPKDELFLVKELGKDEYLQLFLEIKKYHDNTDEYIKWIESNTQEALEKALEEEIREEEKRISEEQYPDFSNINIDELDLSTRSYGALRRAGIKNLEQLSELTIEEFENIRNFGRKSIQEVIEKVKKYGIEIKDKRELVDKEESLPNAPSSVEDEFVKNVMELAMNKVEARTQAEKAAELERLARDYIEKLKNDLRSLD